jgi:hypothetical protein
VLLHERDHFEASIFFTRNGAIDDSSMKLISRREGYYVGNSSDLIDIANSN